MSDLFDKATGFLRLDELVAESPNFQRIISDSIVTDDEVAAQSDKVIKLFKEIEQRFSGKDKELVVNAVSELAVLYAINARRGGV